MPSEPDALIKRMEREKDSISGIPLSRVTAGQRGIIEEIRGGWGLRRRLNEIGIHIGDFIDVIRRAHFGGPTIISIHASKVAIGRGMADKVIVRLVQPDEVMPLPSECEDSR